MSVNKTKPSNRKVVFNKLTNQWDDLNKEDEKALMELEKAKQEQAKKSLDDSDDEPSDDQEQIMCPKCFEWTEVDSPCCP